MKDIGSIHEPHDVTFELRYKKRVFLFHIHIDKAYTIYKMTNEYLLRLNVRTMIVVVVVPIV